MLIALLVTAYAAPNPCFREANPRMIALQGYIDEATTYAEADEAANGVTGTYATASVYALSSLRDAQTALDQMRVEAFSAGSGDGTPAQTYAEAGGSAQLLDRVSDALQLAMWWSAVSTAWHGSWDARLSLEAGADAQGTLNQLRLGAYLCFTNPYLVP